MAATSVSWADAQNPAYRPPPADRAPSRKPLGPKGLPKRCESFTTVLTGRRAREYKACAWGDLGGGGEGMGLSGRQPGRTLLAEWFVSPAPSSTRSTTRIESPFLPGIVTSLSAFTSKGSWSRASVAATGAVSTSTPCPH